MNSWIPLAIEGLVALLLAATIGYCFILNRRLKRLNADDDSLRATIVELVQASEGAERAIAGLRAALVESQQSLRENMDAGRALTLGLAEKIRVGEDVLKRIHLIAAATAIPRGAGTEERLVQAEAAARASTQVSRQDDRPAAPVTETASTVRTTAASAAAAAEILLRRAQERRRSAQGTAPSRAA